MRPHDLPTNPQRLWHGIIEEVHPPVCWVRLSEPGYECHFSKILAHFYHKSCPWLAWEVHRGDFGEKFLSHNLACHLISSIWRCCELSKCLAALCQKVGHLEIEEVNALHKPVYPSLSQNNQIWRFSSSLLLIWLYKPIYCIAYRRPFFWHDAAILFDKWQLFVSDEMTHFITIKWRLFIVSLSGSKTIFYHYKMARDVNNRWD